MTEVLLDIYRIRLVHVEILSAGPHARFVVSSSTDNRISYGLVVAMHPRISCILNIAILPSTHSRDTADRIFRIF